MKRHNGLLVLIIAGCSLFLGSCGNGGDNTSVKTSSGGPNAPTIASISPALGPIGGGTAVTVTGTNFRAGATATLGGTALTGINVVSATQITATSPAHTAGTVDLIITNSDNTFATMTNAFSFTPPPTITSINPVGGSVSGGFTFTVTGTNFGPGASVTLGGAAATGISVNAGGTQITATAAAHSAGVVDLRVVNVDGQSATLTGGFSYNPPPTVTSVSPVGGTTVGGTVITITGANFISGATVFLGAAPATSVVFNSSTQITATTPAHGSGATDVQVRNPDAQIGTLTGGYNYAGPPVIGKISPDSAIARAVQTTPVPTIIIKGTNLQAGAQVLFGTTPSTKVTSNPTSTQLTVEVPAHAAATTENVTVINPDNLSVTANSAFRFGSVLFSDGFESSFTNFDARQTVLDVTDNITPATVHSGVHSAQIHYQICGDSSNATCGASHQDSNRFVEKDFPGGLHEMFIRMYVYFQTPAGGVASGDNLQRKIFYIKSPAGPGGTPDNFWSFVLTSDSVNGKIGLRGNTSPGTNVVVGASLYGGDNELGDQPNLVNGIAELNYDKWYSLELQLKTKSALGANDSVFRLWVDGKLVFEKTNTWTSGTTLCHVGGNDVCLAFPTDSLFNTPITRFEIGQQTDRLKYQVVDELRFIDDIVIADSYIGP